MPTETEDRLKHRMLQKEHGSIYRAISDILFQQNPTERDGKRNTGDYNPVVDEVVSRIREVENVDALQDLLLEVFRTDFGEENAGSRERYEVAASEIWKVYERHRAA